MKTPTTEQWERAVDDILSGGMTNADFQKLLDMGVFRELGLAKVDKIDMKRLHLALNPPEKKPRETIIYVGTLENVMEQGMERHGYGLRQDGYDTDGWDGVVLFDDGDLLAIFDHAGKELHRVKVRMIHSPEGPLTAKGIPWRLWHSYFYPKDKVPFRAELTKFVKPKGKKK
ncbi:MAG TPA: hypothetical protein P5056_02930 [Candidatus Paceibacterota bacterium]|nr:hypothetical protein [Candidatus Paceibacterota bacterium]